MRRLTTAGFMINLRKCSFLVQDIPLLGHHVTAATYGLGDKFFKKHTWTIPSSIKEL